MLVDQARAARLRWAREAANFKTMEEAIQRFNFVGQTYRGHENGNRGISNRKILTYSKAFNVRSEWLLSGEGNPKDLAARVRISGVIREFGTVDDIASPLRLAEGGAREDAEPPPILGDYLAYRVDGDHNYPAFFNSDIVYTSAYGPPENSIGRQCVAVLSDGTKRICILGRGSEIGLFLLMSINASPISDAPVIEAAPVIWIRRG